LTTTAYFSGNGGVLAACVLGGWAVVGLALVVLGPPRATAARQAALPGHAALPAAHAEPRLSVSRRTG
jgi:hypothetical protein